MIMTTDSLGLGIRGRSSVITTTDRHQERKGVFLDGQLRLYDDSLFDEEVERREAGGNRKVVRRAAVNVRKLDKQEGMTSGSAPIKSGMAFPKLGAPIHSTCGAQVIGAKIIQSGQSHVLDNNLHVENCHKQVYDAKASKQHLGAPIHSSGGVQVIGAKLNQGGHSHRLENCHQQPYDA
jgi:hypothetical protein